MLCIRNFLFLILGLTLFLTILAVLSKSINIENTNTLCDLMREQNRQEKSEFMNDCLRPYDKLMNEDFFKEIAINCCDSKYDVYKKRRKFWKLKREKLIKNGKKCILEKIKNNI